MDQRLTARVTEGSILVETNILSIHTRIALRPGTVGIWASWIVAVRLGIKTSLQPWDIVAIRFLVAGVILLPYLLKKCPAVNRLGWIGLTAIMLGGGAPMVMLSYGGLLFAPAAHAASLFTALIPLYVALLAAIVLGEKFIVAKRIGLASVVAGALGMRQSIGDAMFIGAGILWACYTVAMRKARLAGPHAAAIAAVGSLIIYVPAYAIGFGTSLFSAPWRDIVLQAVVQGILTAIVSFLLYGRAVNILGASNGSSFAALAPVVTAILAIPILGEWPIAGDWISMVLISGGVYFASGGPLGGLVPTNVTRQSWS